MLFYFQRLFLTRREFWRELRERGLRIMKKLLIALDDSASAMKAAEYAAAQLSGDNLQVGLVHVLPNLPAIFWDEGHILSDAEKKERKNVVDKWVADRKAKMDPIFKKAVEVLARAGIKAQSITTKSISDSTDVSDSILEEAKDGGYQTILVGRCNRSARHLLGSVSGKIVNHAVGIAVTVVG
jgi:nucleotide-binding universal stress UspA family protein